MPVNLEATFDKETAARLFKSIDNGEPIAPSGKEWTRDDLLILAAVCIDTARTVYFADGDDHSEHREAKALDMAAVIDLIVGRWADLFSRMRWGDQTTIDDIGTPFLQRLRCVIVRDPDSEAIALDFPDTSSSSE